MDTLDETPSVKELNDAIDNLACFKAPELIKIEKPSLLSYLHKLLCLCWEEETVPQDMCDAKSITLYKNKGDRSDCNNYRGSSLLCIVGKDISRVALTRLQVLAERVYPESQYSFWKERSTVDMIFTVR